MSLLLWVESDKKTPRLHRFQELQKHILSGPYPKVMTKTERTTTFYYTPNLRNSEGRILIFTII